MKQKPALESNEYKVVLYLSHYSKNIDDPEAPPQVTAGGIAQVLGVKRSIIEGVLKSLIMSGNVRSWSNHIKGEPKKKTVHFLTREGENRSMYIIDVMRTSQIMVDEKEIVDLLARTEGSDRRSEEGGNEVPAKSLHDRLSEIKGKKIRFLRMASLFDFIPSNLELLMGLKDAKVLSLEKVKRAHSKTLAMRPVLDWVDFSSQVQICPHFYGRVHELEHVEQFLESINNQILVIKGIDGIGKTSLTSVITSMVKGTRHVFWYDFHEHTSIKHLLTSLSLFLHKFKIPVLRNYLNHQDDLDMNEVLHIIETSLYDTHAMLVFEDVHKVNDERIVNLFRGLKEAVEGMMGTKVIVTGRTIIPFYSHDEVGPEEVIMELPLAGLDQEAVKKILVGKGVARDDLDRYIEVIKGHPMYSEMVSTLGLSQMPKTINFYIDSELDNRLSLADKKVLTFMSVYRHPVPPKAIMKRIHKFEDGNEVIPTEEVLDGLKSKGLIRYDANEDNLSLHDIIMEHFYDLMMPKVRRSAHHYAAAYYLEEKEDLHRLEVLYHLIMADEDERAADFAIEKKKNLFRTGYLEDLLVHLNKIDKGLLPSNIMLDLSLLEGEILIRTGQLESASSSFRLASKMAGQLGNDLARAHALFQLGEVLRKMDMFTEAESCYLQGMDILEFEGQPNDLAIGHNGLGMILKGKGSYSEACEHFEEGLLEARKARSSDLASDMVTNLGECKLKRGDIEGAIKVLTENFRLIEANRDHDILAKAHSLVGVLHFLKEEWAKATNSFQSGAMAAKRSGNSRLLATNLLEGAVPFLRKGEPERADEFLEEAEEIYGRLKDRNGLAHVELKRAELYQLGDDLDTSEGAYRRAIRILEGLDDVEDLSMAYTGLASILDQKGDKDQAQKFRRKGMEISTRAPRPE